ncbi:hypothetical protein C8J57DRAFT_1241496 [Mycena rebaudengoi]|nr:hypothetical protein C8J57DRAFT_1241496 [Mycena rebaudengoi]
MQPPGTLKNLIEYTTLAATTAQAIGTSAQVPFLPSTAALTLAILKCAQSVRSNRDECAQLLEQIHEILCLIVKLYSTSEINGVLSPALLYDIAQFTETLQKVLTFLSGKQGIGKLKQLFKKLDTARTLTVCRQELNTLLHKFKIQAIGSIMSEIAQVRQDAKQQHEELVFLLQSHPSLTNSDVSSMTETLSSFGLSSGSLSLLPVTPKIFYGRDLELKSAVNILIQDSARIAILGMGGMGKTNLATAALHDPQVETKYSYRYFVPCHSSPTCTELVAAIADHIGLEKGTNMTKKIAQHFAHAPPSLLVLDNLETPWESVSSRSQVEDFLSLLTDIPHLGLMITMRGAERPAKVKWTRPFLDPLEPLSTSAAFQTFVAITDDGHNEDSINKLLELTGNMPLAVNLIANVAAYEGCDMALSRWKSESTRMLSDGYDKRSSLDISIMLSLTSSRMTSGAQDLLGIISMLPDGVTDADLVQAELPVPNILSCKTTLLQTSLAFIDKDRKLKVLVPIREHILSTHAPTNAVKLQLRHHFHKLLDLWNQSCRLNAIGITPQIVQNLGNMNASPFLPKLSAYVENLQDHPIFGEYLVELFNSSDHLPVIDSQNLIALGNRYFESKAPLEQAKWYRALGVHVLWGNSGVRTALDFFQESISLSDTSGSPSVVGHQCLVTISQMMITSGNRAVALEYAKKAEEYAYFLGDIYGQAFALTIQGRCYVLLANHQCAQILLQNATNLLHSCGLKDSFLAVQIQNLMAEIHLLKTQYQESRDIQVLILSNLQPQTYHAIATNLNIVSIDTATGVDSEIIKSAIDTCCLSIKSLHGYTQTHMYLWIDLRLAEIFLQDGDHTAAYELFARTFTSASAQDTFIEEVLLCLERLADLSTNMNNIQNTLRWAGIYFALASKSKELLATMKALYCVGQILSAQGDVNAALSILTVALDGFTFMDVHRWRGDCMVQIAGIMEQRGATKQSVELLKAARPLFERSSQANNITQIDAKLQFVDAQILEQYGQSLQIGMSKGNV